MKVSVLFFGIAKDIAKSNSIEMEVNDKSTLEELKNTLIEIYPEFVSINDFSLAVNETYIEGEYFLKAHDVIAIIPPVSGG